MSSKKITIFDFILGVLLASISIVAISFYINNINTPWQHFSDQANSFWQGKLDVSPNPFDKHDYVILANKYYWPQGPFPSVLLMPFQKIFGVRFHQGIMQLLLIGLLVILAYKLCRVRGFDRFNCFYLVAVFLIGSPIAGLLVDPKSWFFAQIVAVTFLSGLLLELETKRRWLIIGLLNAALIATRPTAGIIFFALIIIIFVHKQVAWKKLINLILLFVPVFFSLSFLMWFNFQRFGNPLDNGYLTNDVGGFIEPMRRIGLFNLQHIPTNIYYYFIASVEPVTNGKQSVHLAFPFIKYNDWGTSLFLVAPFFIYSLKSFKGDSKYTKLLWGMVLITLFLHLTYYTPGWSQFGPRYTADFFPILFLLTLYGLDSKLSKIKKTIIILSCSLNLYLLMTPALFKDLLVK